MSQRRADVNRWGNGGDELVAFIVMTRAERSG